MGVGLRIAGGRGCGTDTDTVTDTTCVVVRPAASARCLMRQDRVSTERCGVCVCAKYISTRACVH